MEPRYEAGEAVYVNPGLPVRKLDWVVVQVRLQNAVDGDPPAGYIKQFISKDERKTKLRQLNPDKVIEFPSDRVVSIHKIVGTATAYATLTIRGTRHTHIFMRLRIFPLAYRLCVCA